MFLQVLVFFKEYWLQYLVFEMVLNLVFVQFIFGILEQVLSFFYMVIEFILVDGVILDKGCVMFLVVKCQVVLVVFYDQLKKVEVLEVVIENFNEVKNYFVKVDCKE